MNTVIGSKIDNPNQQTSANQFLEHLFQTSNSSSRKSTVGTNGVGRSAPCSILDSILHNSGEFSSANNVSNHFENHPRPRTELSGSSLLRKSIQADRINLKPSASHNIKSAPSDSRVSEARHDNNEGTAMESNFDVLCGQGNYGEEEDEYDDEDEEEEYASGGENTFEAQGSKQRRTGASSGGKSHTHHISAAADASTAASSTGGAVPSQPPSLPLDLSSIKAKNREHAKNTRLREKNFIAALKEDIKKLSEERERLDAERRGALGRLAEQVSRSGMELGIVNWY